MINNSDKSGKSDNDNDNDNTNIDIIDDNKDDNDKNSIINNIISNNSNKSEDPITIIFEQIIKEAFSIEKNNMLLPIAFDCKIENFDENGNIKYEKSFGSKDNKWFFEDNEEKILSENIEDIENLENFEDLEHNQKNKKKISIKKNNQDNFNKVTILNKVDYASSIGDENYLNEWIKSNINLNKKFIGSNNDYSTEAIDNASCNGKKNILNWWLKAQKNHDIELKYTDKSINLASKYDHVDILDWWAKSELKLKYNHCAIDNASSGCKLKTLNWWLNAKNIFKWDFNYTSNSIDNAKLDEQRLLKLIKWWKTTISTNPDIKFKYTKKFIDYIDTWEYTNTYNFLLDNKMINPNDKINSNKKKSNVLNLFEMFGMPIGPSMKTKDSVSSKYDIESLPEDIQKHIKEKEEELSNNMLINGKAKEYIDNLIKIPFGKYKIEKIFCFIQDFIDKINTINLNSNNTIIKTNKILNESDLIIFLKNIKYYSENTYEKYLNLYEKFLLIRNNYLKYINKILDTTIYGHEATKTHLKCIISQWLSGGFKTGVVIGIQGPPGVGKTTFIKGALAKCLVDFIEYDLDSETPFINEINYNSELKPLPRSFCFMSLGGTTNGSTLSGHNITYHGATSGDIVKSLKEANIMNPILYFDELDKISNTEHGHEISSVLTHITDPIQNNHFTDRYFSEVKIDLSKCIIVFSYNDSNKIDRILLDRIQEIRLNPIKHSEKIIISKKFIIPEICNQLGYNQSDFLISDDKLDLIISEYTLEAGVRKLKEKLFEIFRMYHLEFIQKSILIDKLLSDKKNITKKFINDTFCDYPKIMYKKIRSNNIIGCINGLYASSSGIGGITPIQVKQIYLKENLGISITGSIEKVMEESVKVAKTVAWNLLTNDEQENVIKNWDSRGIHIHFPDGSTPKDGPSGGTAITCAIYSLLTSKPIKNNVAITGEIDLDGNVTQIGGLDAKLIGAKKSGVNIVLIPKENSREFNIVKKNNPELLSKDFKVNMINHVSEAIKFII